MHVCSELESLRAGPDPFSPRVAHGLPAGGIQPTSSDVMAYIAVPTLFRLKDIGAASRSYYPKDVNIQPHGRFTTHRIVGPIVQENMGEVCEL